MILTIDVGNTNIVFAVYDDAEFVFSFRSVTDDTVTKDYYINIVKKEFLKKGFSVGIIEGAIISSVVPPVNILLEQTVTDIFKCKAKILDSNLKTGLEICTDHPEKVGADLICGASIAYYKHKSAVIVFDLGTATTVCAVDKSGKYLGHSIFPGINTSFKALSTFTARLPMIEKISDKQQVIGKNTVASIESGVVFGTACFVDGMVERYKEILGEETKVVITGGLSQIIIPYCRTPLIFEENLLVEGLVYLYKLNS